MVTYPKVLFKNEGSEGASAQLLLTTDRATGITWEGGSSEPTLSGEDDFTKNLMFKAAYFDYLIHKKAQQKAAAEDILPAWEETADETHANFGDDSAQAEKSYEEKLKKSPQGH